MSAIVRSHNDRPVFQLRRHQTFRDAEMRMSMNTVHQVYSVVTRLVAPLCHKHTSTLDSTNGVLTSNQYPRGRERRRHTLETQAVGNPNPARGLVRWRVQDPERLRLCCFLHLAVCRSLRHIFGRSSRDSGALRNHWRGCGAGK